MLQSLRAPARYIVLVQFALAILAALTFEDLLAIADGRRARADRSLIALWDPAALGVVTTIALNTGLLPSAGTRLPGVSRRPPGCRVVGAVTLLVYLAARRVRWALAALVIVTAADLGAVGDRVRLAAGPAPDSTR